MAQIGTESERIARHTERQKTIRSAGRSSAAASAANSASDAQKDIYVMSQGGINTDDSNEEKDKGKTTKKSGSSGYVWGS